MRKLSILVIEDNPLAAKTLAANLSPHDLDFAHDFESGRRKLADGRYDICFIDLKLGAKDDCSGLELIAPAKAKGVYAVVMSGHDTEPTVERAYDLGCDDFYAKGNEDTNVGRLLEKFQQLRQAGGKDSLFADRFVTQDAATRAGVEEALKFASSELPILILGPSGTGKTSLARLIHDHSRRSGEFVSINCAAYTEDLLEAELFGYRKGAFTGAADGRKGKLLQAHGGTLFLDEIGSMSLKMQTKLLKAIEEKLFYPLGSDTPETSEFRIISATLENVQTLIRLGTLRFDFFQRIHGLTVVLKPLNGRKGDIFPLILAFTRGGKRLSFSEDARSYINLHDWPGNIRELKKFVDLLVAGGEGRVSLETARRLLSAIPPDEPERRFATDEQYRHALSDGINAAIDRFVDSLVERSLAVNGGKKTSVLSDLKIGTRLLYSSLQRIQPANIRRNKRTHGPKIAA
jgi:two-component system nitrogen regulation response regulator NtrX